MPYKNNRMKFAENKELVAPEEIREAVEDLQLAIDLKQKPVGVKFLNTKEAYDEAPGRAPKSKLAYCQMIAYARKGKMIKSTVEHHLCDGATTALGLEASTPKIESGEEYFSYHLFGCRAAARRLRASIQSLDGRQVQTYGIVVGPADQFATAPDLVILIVDPYQTMRLVQGYEYKTGKPAAMHIGAMQAMCSELTAVPLLSGEINVSVLCPSTRMLCHWKKEDMGIAIPFEKFYEVVDGVFATMSTTESKPSKRAIIARFAAAGRTLDLDPNVGY